MAHLGSNPIASFGGGAFYDPSGYGASSEITDHMSPEEQQELRDAGWTVDHWGLWSPPPGWQSSAAGPAPAAGAAPTPRDGFTPWTPDPDATYPTASTWEAPFGTAPEEFEVKGPVPGSAAWRALLKQRTYNRMQARVATGNFPPGDTRAAERTRIRGNVRAQMRANFRDKNQLGPGGGFLHLTRGGSESDSDAGSRSAGRDAFAATYQPQTVGPQLSEFLRRPTGRTPALRAQRPYVR